MSAHILLFYSQVNLLMEEFTEEHCRSNFSEISSKRGKGGVDKTLVFNLSVLRKMSPIIKLSPNFSKMSQLIKLSPMSGRAPVGIGQAAAAAHRRRPRGRRRTMYRKMFILRRRLQREAGKVVVFRPGGKGGGEACRRAPSPIGEI